jgi:DNA-binding NarL/FixJ family response regulator
MPPSPEQTLADQLELAQGRWKLTRQQLEVLNALADGKTNKEIADLLAISARTVEAHVIAITQKAAVSSRLQVIAGLWKLR